MPSIESSNKTIKILKIQKGFCHARPHYPTVTTQEQKKKEKQPTKFKIMVSKE